MRRGNRAATALILLAAKAGGLGILLVKVQDRRRRPHRKMQTPVVGVAPRQGVRANISETMIKRCKRCDQDRQFTSKGY
jgi:hypothetical protein